MLEMTFEVYLSDTELDDPIRLHATEIYQRCLNNGSSGDFHKFIEQLFLQDPLPLESLYAVAVDLQQRLRLLNQYHFDIRARVLNTLLNIYEVDVSAIIPLSRLAQYHRLHPKTFIERIRQTGVEFLPVEEEVLRDMIISSIEISAQLYRDTRLTQQLSNMLEDWLHAHMISSLRQSQSQTAQTSTDGTLILH